MPLVLAQISDLHFGQPSYNPLQFFSKRWLGNLNLIYSRRKAFLPERLAPLIDLFKQQGVTHVAITGDLSVTGRNKELLRASDFAKELEVAGMQVFAVPGNHDHYTRRGYKNRTFYRYFPSSYQQDVLFNLKDHQVTYTHLKNQLWLVAIDTSLATSLISSEGRFTESAEYHLETVLNEIPKGSQVIVMTHYPLFQIDPPRKRLQRAEELKKLLERHPSVKLYLHGHTHRQMVADLRPNKLPILSDTGSTVFRSGGGCHIFKIDPKQIKLDVYRFDQNWIHSTTHEFAL